MDINKSKYKVWNWKSPVILHWILNPGLAFNEIVLGQRQPKITLIDKSSDKPLMERTYIPCPHCETIHDGRIWSTENGTAFKNWFGIYCPECGNIIPCLHNGLTYLLIFITYPLWGWAKDHLKQQWLEKQPQRYKNLDTDYKTYKQTSWAKMGLIFGIILAITTALFLIAAEPTPYFEVFYTSAGTGILSGLCFGVGMKYWMGLKGKEA